MCMCVCVCVCVCVHVCVHVCVCVRVCVCVHVCRIYLLLSMLGFCRYEYILLDLRCIHILNSCHWDLSRFHLPDIKEKCFFKLHSKLIKTADQ